jgi:tRNA (cytidine/uridine-2'-O-)-methyltransferase
MFDVVLFRPEIPPNAGNVIRLCANAGARLHLIEPLGFSMDDRQLRRAGLDYHELATVLVHRGLGGLPQTLRRARLFAFSTRGARRYSEVEFRAGMRSCSARRNFGPARGRPRELPEDRRLRLSDAPRQSQPQPFQRRWPWWCSRRGASRGFAGGAWIRRSR